MNDAGRLNEARQRLARSARPVVLTGAGISAESGVPVFRGPEGLWRNFRPEELATPEAFEKDPVLVWQWYDWRRGRIAAVRPNPAHRALAGLEKRFSIINGTYAGESGAAAGRGGFTLITQNVDGLHTLAGSKNVLEIHGSIWKVRCTACGTKTGNRDVPVKMPPRCPCGGLLRPGVVWFGEALPEDVFEAALLAAVNADFMMVIGTSGAVEPAASLARRARQAGAFTVEINTENTPLSPLMDAVFTGRAGDIVPGFL